MTDVQIYALFLLILTTGILMYASYRCGKHDAYAEGFTNGTKATCRDTQRFTENHHEPLNSIERETAA